MIYITGDLHGRLERIRRFCEKMQTTKEDIMIVLGDAGLNYYGYYLDRKKKLELAQYPITVFCIHGNHEQRPERLLYYKEKQWNGGTVYWEPEFSNLLFAKDGEIYELGGKTVIAIGGAYSVDKMWRIVNGGYWWEDEQPSEEIKARVEKKLEEIHWKVDVVLSHTAPLKYEPLEAFLSGIDQSTVDKSTEIWLDAIEEKLQYGKWYLGHYHIDKKIDKIQIVFQDVECLEESE